MSPAGILLQMCNKCHNSADGPLVVHICLAPRAPTAASRGRWPALHPGFHGRAKMNNQSARRKRLRGRPKHSMAECQLPPADGVGWITCGRMYQNGPNAKFTHIAQNALNGRGAAALLSVIQSPEVSREDGANTPYFIIGNAFARLVWLKL